jgi:hypothetical protein
MGSFVVELGPEAVEAELLGPAVLLGWSCGFTLEGSVHAFVASVLLGFTGLDKLGNDAETDPPDGELGDAAERVCGEGWAVVGPDPLRKAVLLEKPFEHGPCAPNGGPGKPVTGQQKATEAILDGEGITVAAIEGFELTLEVSGPDGVGFIHGGHGSTRMRTFGTLPTAWNQSMPFEDLMGRGGGWEMPVGVSAGNANEELPGAPGRVAFPVTDELFDNGLRNLVGASMGSA